MNHSKGFLALVHEARKKIQETDVPTVRARLKKKTRPFLLIDVREDHEWAKGHLPGAKHLGRGILERDVETLYPDKKKEIILYCGGGYRSALSAYNMQKMGYKNVWSMDGGFRGWVENGGKILKPR